MYYTCTYIGRGGNKKFSTSIFPLKLLWNQMVALCLVLLGTLKILWNFTGFKVISSGVLKDSVFTLFCVVLHSECLTLVIKYWVNCINRSHMG